MTTTPVPLALYTERRTLLRQVLQRAWAFSPILTFSAFAHLALIPLFAAAAIADPRIITGAPAWIKPLKFAISIAIYTGTFVWLLTFVQGHRRLVRLAAAITGIGLTLEMVLIALQVLRGTTSHFNVSTAFDAAIFGIMGAAITAVALLSLLLAIWLIRQRLPDQVFAWGLRLGVLVSFIGMMVAFLMTSPTAEQLSAAQAGQPLTVAGGHSVSVADGGEGLPFLGWSTTGGDLRIPHFVGLHALQVLPLAAWVLTRDRAHRRWSAQGRLGLVWTAGLGYLGIVALLTWQALRGQSILAPDGLTITAFAGLASTVILAIGMIARRDI
jgi:hypothetical protein